MKFYTTTEPEEAAKADGEAAKKTAGAGRWKLRKKANTGLQKTSIIVQVFS